LAREEPARAGKKPLAGTVADPRLPAMKGPGAARRMERSTMSGRTAAVTAAATPLLVSAGIGARQRPLARRIEAYLYEFLVKAFTQAMANKGSAWRTARFVSIKGHRAGRKKVCPL